MMRVPAAPAFSTPIVPLIISILALTTATTPSTITDHGNDVYDHAGTLYRKLDFLECTGCIPNKQFKGNCTVYGTIDDKRFLKLFTFYKQNNYVDLVDGINLKSIKSCLVSKYLIWHVNFLLQPYKDSFNGAVFNFTKPLSAKNLSNIELKIQTKAELFDLLEIEDFFMVFGIESDKMVNNTDIIRDYFAKLKQGNTYFSGNTTHFESFELPTVVVDDLKNRTETIEKIESNISQVFQALIEDLESKNSNLSKTIEHLESKKSNPISYKIIAFVTICVLTVMIFSIVILAVMLVKEKKSKFKTPAADQNKPTSIIINAGNDVRYQ